MPTTIPIEQAQANLLQVIENIAPGEGVVITQNDHPVAELRGLAARPFQPKFGNCRGMLTIVAEDDEHLRDFEDYMIGCLE